MNLNLFLIFVALNIVNVIIQTVKSIATVKAGKLVASITNAVAYGLYTVVLIYMTCDLSTWVKALVVGGCNLIGVYVVKFIEEKTQKAKLWKIELAVKDADVRDFGYKVANLDIPFSILDTSGTRTIINVYASTFAQSEMVKKLIENSDFDIKYFVTESKAL